MEDARTKPLPWPGIAWPLPEKRFRTIEPSVAPSKEAPIHPFDEISLSATERLAEEPTASNPTVSLDVMELLSTIVFLAPSSKIPRPAYETSFRSIVISDEESSATPVWPSSWLPRTVIFHDDRMYTPALPRVETFSTVVFDAESK